VLANLEALGGAFLDGPAPVVSWLSRRWALELAGAPWSTGVRVLALDELDLTGPRIETLDATALAARCHAAADWGAAAAGAAKEPHPQARLAGRLGDELAVAICPDNEAPPSCPGVVVIGCRPGGLHIDFGRGHADVPGIGPVPLAPPDDAEVAAALAAATAEAEAPPATADPALGVGEPAPLLAIPAKRPQQESATQESSPSVNPSIQLLGPFKVSGVSDPPRAQIVEMAALLALRREGWSLATFQEAIWRNRRGSDTSPPSTKTVSTRIGNLRGWLGGQDTVITEGDNIRLGRSMEVDWWRFETLSCRPETMAEALQLLRGQPLEGVLYGWAERDYWVQAIEARVVAVALGAAEGALRHDRWEEAFAAAEVGLKWCPYDQRLTRAAMRAAAAGGDVELVHVLVARAEVELDEDEGLDPETMELLQALTAKGDSSNSS
jgi:DNA-binding SARP family transcriptional activator